MKEKKNELLLIPNILSLFRIVLVPVFIYIYFTEKPHGYWALVVLAISFLTDVLDGKIARKYNMISETGRILDPLADKITQFTVLVVLYIDGKVPVIFPLLVLLKELTMLVGAIYLKKYLKTDVISSNFWGKSATGTFYLSAALYLLNFDSVAIYFLSAALVLLFIAFGSYADGFLRIKNTDKE